MAFNLKNHLKLKVPSLSGLTEEEASTRLDLNLPPPGFVSFCDPPSDVKYGKIEAKKVKVTRKRCAKAQGLSLGGEGLGRGSHLLSPPSGGNKRARLGHTELAPPSSAAESLICVGCTFCFVYNMVPVSDPKCPKCNNADRLIDFQNPNPARKARKN